MPPRTGSCLLVIYLYPLSLPQWLSSVSLLLGGGSVRIYQLHNLMVVAVRSTVRNRPVHSGQAKPQLVWVNLLLH